MILVIVYITITINSKLKDILISCIFFSFIFCPLVLTVPPNESAYSFFDPDVGDLEILILHGNPHPIEENRAVNYNTAAPGMRADRISKCAKVGLFSKVTYFSSSSKGKNVLLKYQGNGVVEPRMGVTISYNRYLQYFCSYFSF